MLYYYGGKFNPWTKGHFNVLKSLIEKIHEEKSWGEKDTILIGVTELEDQSGIKGHHLCSSEGYRMEMIYPAIQHLITTYPFLNRGGGIEVEFQSKKYTYEFLEKYCAEHHINNWKKNVTLVLGEDEYNDLCGSISDPTPAKSGKRTKKAIEPAAVIKKPKWQYADEVVKFNMFVAPRQTGNGAISSTKVRDIFYRNPYTSYDDVKDYLSIATFDHIKSWHHYWQMGYEDEYRREENNAIRKYDITKFPRPSATADIIVTIAEPSPKDNEVLLVRRKNFPYKGFWALPGGFMDINEDENLEETASRELREETGIEYNIRPSHQFRIYSDIGTDPRGRIIDTVYVIGGSEWYPKAGDDAAELNWFKISELPRMAFNHRQIITDYLEYVIKAQEGHDGQGHYHDKH